MRRFEFEEDGSSKFWEVAVDGASVTVRFGKIGAAGQSKTKDFASDAEASKEAAKLVGEKTRKGYREVGGAVETVVAPPVHAPAPAQPTAPSAVEPVAPAAPAPESPAPTLTLKNGETVRFVVPEWMPPLALPLHGDKVRLPKAMPFEKLWEGTRKSLASWLLPKPYPWDWRAGEALASGPALDLMQRVRARLEPSAPPEAAPFDDALEAVTWALACLAGADRDTRTERALASWTAQTDPKRAALTLLRATRIGFHAAGTDQYPRPIVLDLGGKQRTTLFGPDLEAVRDHLIFHGGRGFADELHAAMATDQPEDRAALARMLDDADLAERVVAGEPAAWIAATLLYLVRDETTASASLGLLHSAPDILRVVLKHGLGVAQALFDAVGADPRRGLVQAMAAYPSLHVARLLVPMLANKVDRKLVGDALACMPAEALVALREARAKRTTYPDALDALISTMSAALAAGTPSDDTLAEAGPEEAPLDALPPVLARPPWRQKRKAGEVVRLTLEPRTLPVQLSFEGHDEVQLRREVEYAHCPHTVADWKARVAAHNWVDGASILGLTPADLDELLTAGVAAQANFDYFGAYNRGLPHLLVKFGLAVVPLLREIGSKFPTQTRTDLALVGDAALAPKMVEWAGQKAMRRAVARWVRLHPRHAAAGLIPLALGEPGKTRDRAELLLAATAAPGPESRALVLTEAAAYGEAAAQAVVALLDRDPLLNAPSKPPKLPETTANLPAPRLRDGRALPRDAVNALLEMLAFTPLDPPYVGVEQVCDACDPRSLDTFAEALVRAFVAAGMSTAHEWMVRAVALLGTDVSARFLYSRGLAWAADGQKQRAMLVLETLGALGSDVALSLVGRASRTGQRAYFKERAGEILAEIAAARGLTPAELEDRTAPDLELDENGTVVLDFGPRQFRVGFDEHLLPHVATLEGERLPSLPRANKADDAEKAKAASETWKTLKTEAEKVARDQIRRLEQILTTERRLEQEVFVGSFLRHPLIGHLTRRLVWGVYKTDGSLLGAFRVAEDRTLADAEDNTYTIPEGAQIGLVHPLRMTPNAVAAWSTILSDYNVVQPFAQIGRPMYDTTLDALIERLSGKKAMAGPIYALRNHGFTAMADEDGFSALSAQVAPGLLLHLSFEPSVQAGDDKEHAVSMHVRSEGSAKSAGVDPLRVSELALVLERALTR